MEKQAVAMAKLICPVCGKEQPTLVVDKKFRKTLPANIDKPIGYLDEPCTECKDYMNKGIIIISVDVDKTTEPDNPFRTGHILVVKEELFNEIPDKRAIYMDYRELLEVGLLSIEAVKEYEEKVKNHVNES